MAQKVEVELVAKEGGFFAMLAKGIRGFQDFAEKGKASAAAANAASKEHLATIEKMEARVRSLTQQWMKLKAQQMGGDSSKGLNDQLRATNRELAGASSDLTRFKANSGMGPAAEAGGLEAGIARMKGLAAGALGAYVSIEALKHGLKESVEGTLEWVKTSMAMGNTLGISTERASALKVAIGDVYATEEEFNNAVGKVTKTLNTKEDTFTKLGVATRDANGHLRPTIDILLDTNTALGQLKGGTDRNVAAQAVFGKGWMEVQKVMKLNNTVMEEARAKAERLGLIVGGDLVEATNRFRAAQNDADDTFQAMKIAVGQELLPVLTDFNEWAAEDGPKSLGVLSGIIRVLITALKTVAFIIQADGAIIGVIIGQIITNVTALGDILYKVFTGDFKGAGAAAKRWWQDTKNNFSAGADEIKDRFEKLGLSLNQVWDPNLRPKAKTSPKGGDKRGDTFKEDKEQDKQFEQLKAFLAHEQESYENRKMAQGQYVEWSKAQDAIFWKGQLERQDLSEKTRAKATQEYFKARREVLKKANEEDKQLQATYRERDKAEALGNLSEEEALVQQARERRLIGEREALEEFRRIEEERYQIELQSLNDALAMANLEPAERAKIHGQLEELERQHQAKLREIRVQQQDLNRQSDGWAGAMSALDDILTKGQNKFEQFKTFTNDIFQGMEQGYLAALNGMVTGQMTPLQALQTGMATFATSVMQALLKIGAQEAALWTIQKAKALWERQAQAQKLAGNTAEIASSAAKTAASTTETTANTGAAVSGFTKAHAGIPFVGWAIALGFIVAFLSLMSSLKARAVGGRVSRPEVTLLGEAGPEIVAPESDFQDYTAGIFRMGMNLQANLARRQGMIAAYDAEATGYARRASSMQSSAAASGGGAFGGDTFQLSFPGMQVWDHSDRGKEQFGNWVMDAIQVAARRRGQVLVPGTAGGSF